MSESVELTRLELERTRIDGELELRRAEVALKRDEFEAAQQGRKHRTFSPLVTGVIAAIVGLLGTGLGAYMQGRSELDVERARIEADLILKAIETGNPEESSKNLLFLVKAGFLQDRDGSIAALAKSPQDAPVLPSRSPSSIEPLPMSKPAPDGPLNRIDVMWWNIRNFTSGSRDDTEMRQIAEVIRGMEVIAIGELEEPRALERLVAALGPTWKHGHTAKVGRTAHTAEHYGFIWDSDVVAIVGNPQNDPDPNNQFDRDPGWATFRTNDGNLDFTVIAVHVTWGNRVAPRRAECRAMHAVYERVQAATPEDRDLIVVGDFGRNASDESFDLLLSIPGMVRATEDTASTHVSSTSTYDQIFLSTDHTVEWVGIARTALFDEWYFDDDDAAASLACSDHRPVWVPLNVPGQDDD